MIDSFWLDIIRLGAVIFLVLANGFFVAAEFSLVSVRRTRIAELVSQGNESAEAVKEALENPDRIIAATQLGITLASLGLGWIGEPAVAHLLDPLIAWFPVEFRPGVAHTISIVLAFSLITFLHVVAGELAPKSIALQNPERASLFVARPTLWTEFIFKPAIWLLNGAGNALLRLVKIQPASGHQLVHSVAELKMLVQASAKEGVVEAEESEMLHAVFDFGSLVIRQVMIPRTEIIAVEADVPLSEILRLVSESTYTKFPVYEDNLDQILGIVHIKELITALQQPNPEKFVARDFVRDALFVPDTISVSSLLRMFRDNRLHIAIALDEFGGTSGLITLEDLLEEIVGEVSDPFDSISPEFQVLADGSIMIEGMTMIEDVNMKLGLNLVDPDYDTIAGYVLGKLGRIPKVNDVIEADNLRLRVEEMDGRRVSKLTLILPENSTPGSPGKSSASKHESIGPQPPADL
jgi:CBS domain containing-hemolysin-like protein